MWFFSIKNIKISQEKYVRKRKKEKQRTRMDNGEERSSDKT